jgi:hypothetical protein
VGCLPQPFLLTETKGPRGFKTRVVTQVMENGPTPDTAAFIQKVEEVEIKDYLFANKERVYFF